MMDLDEEFAKMNAATIAETAIRQMIDLAEANIAHEDLQSPESGASCETLADDLRRYVQNLRRDDLEDAFLSLLDVTVTKQWLMPSWRRDCPCGPCQQSKAMTEGGW